MRFISAIIVFAVALPTALTAQRASVSPFDEGALLIRSVERAVTAPARWTKSDVLMLPVAAAGLATLSLLDNSGRSLMRRNQSAALSDFIAVVEPLGTVSNYKVLGAFYVAGLITDDERARAVAAEGVASSVVAGLLITPALQLIVGRSRPRTDRDPHTFDAFGGEHSFPSGHTTQAFAVASVIATEYEQWWVKAGSYGLASLVGFARMYDDAHYLSDVATAALIGTLVGRTIVHQRHKAQAHEDTRKGSR